MNSDLLEMVDSDFEEIFKADESSELVEKVINFNDLDVFNLIVERVEKFDISLAEYMRKRRKLLNQKSLFGNGEHSLFIYPDVLIKKIREYTQVEKVISNIKESFSILSVSSKKAKKIVEEFYMCSSKIDKLNHNERELFDNNDHLFDCIIHFIDKETEAILWNIRNNISNNQNYQVPKEKLAILRNKLAKNAVDILISDFFQDAPTNFLKTINRLVDFQGETNFISLESLKLYGAIIKLYNNPDIDAVKKLYEEMSKSKKNYMEILYDEIGKARMISAKMLVDATYKCNNTSIKSIDGVPCYMLDGEPFYMIVHGSYAVIDDFSKGKNDGLSLSFISGDRLLVYQDDVIYGFTDLLPEQFVNIYKSDVYTEFKIFSEDNDKSSLPFPPGVPFFASPKRLIDNTDYYNELLYISQSPKYDINITVPKPSYIVCYDNVNDLSLEAAKKNNIPIVIIDTKKYPKIPHHPSHFVHVPEEDKYKDNAGRRL